MDTARPIATTVQRSVAGRMRPAKRPPRVPPASAPDRHDQRQRPDHLAGEHEEHRRRHVDAERDGLLQGVEPRQRIGQRQSQRGQDDDAQARRRSSRRRSTRQADRQPGRRSSRAPCSAPSRRVSQARTGPWTANRSRGGQDQPRDQRRETTSRRCPAAAAADHAAERRRPAGDATDAPVWPAQIARAGPACRRHSPGTARRCW